MKPSLLSGDIILVNTQCKSLKMGEIVIFQAHGTSLIVKRLTKLGKSLVQLKGDNARLESSLCDQELNAERIAGRVVALWRRPFKFKWITTKLS